MWGGPDAVPAAATSHPGRSAPGSTLLKRGSSSPEIGGRGRVCRAGCSGTGRRPPPATEASRPPAMPARRLDDALPGQWLDRECPWTFPPPSATADIAAGGLVGERADRPLTGAARRGRCGRLPMARWGRLLRWSRAGKSGVLCRCQHRRRGAHPCPASDKLGSTGGKCGGPRGRSSARHRKGAALHGHRTRRCRRRSRRSPSSLGQRRYCGAGSSGQGRRRGRGGEALEVLSHDESRIPSYPRAGSPCRRAQR